MVINGYNRRDSPNHYAHQNPPIDIRAYSVNNARKVWVHRKIPNKFRGRIRDDDEDGS